MNIAGEFMKQVRRTLRARQMALTTEQSYCYWIRHFIRYCRYQQPEAINTADVTRFLTYLAVDRHVSPNTQNQAINALLFLFRHVLNLPMENIQAVRSKEPQRIPVVLNRSEVDAILQHLLPTYKTMIQLAWGAGLRKMEILRLRIKDVDFERHSLTVRQGKGRKDRNTVLPNSCVEMLRQLMQQSLQKHQLDVQQGFGSVEMPFALAKKFPDQIFNQCWQFVFSAPQRGIDPRSGVERRHHLHPSGLEKHLRQAVRRSGVLKKVSCHTFRHTFATNLLECGYDIRTVQELLGHTDVKTTQIYTHVLNLGQHAIISPADR